MKKIFALTLSLILAVGVFGGCGKKEETKKTELTVFAAASLQETLAELGEAYMKKRSDVSVAFNFDSSGTLKRQIQEGAPCDAFISAGQKQMDRLDIEAASEKNPDGLDFVLAGSRFDILENKVVLVVPEGNPKNINSFADLKKGLETGDILFAMGDSDVPVGQYTFKILSHLGFDEAKLRETRAVAFGSNVKEVATQVSEGAADCGVVYQTDAASAGLTVADTATQEMCGRVVYPAAVIKSGASPEEARAFLEFLRSEEAGRVFSAVGFTPIAR